MIGYWTVYIVLFLVIFVFFSGLWEKAKSSIALIHFQAELLTRRIWTNEILFVKLSDLKMSITRGTNSLYAAVEWISPFFTKLSVFLPNGYRGSCNNALTQNQIWTNLRQARHAITNLLPLNNDRLWMETLKHYTNSIIVGAHPIYSSIRRFILIIIIGFLPDHYIILKLYHRHCFFFYLCAPFEVLAY